MISLTGYGKGIVEVNGLKIVMELKSVNHRYLDLSFKMPKLFNYTEDSLRKAISAKCSRGHIDVYITYEDNRISKQTMEINEGLADMLINTSRKIADKYSITDDISTSYLLKYPDVVNIKNNEESEDLLLSMAQECINIALDKLVIMRKNEGAAMRQDIMLRIDSIDSMLKLVCNKAPLTITDYKNKLKIRITEALEDISIDQSRLINEVAFFTDKCNIDEEIARLNQHIASFKSISVENNSIGRKLDFLVQEINREINTIGSKAQDSEIAMLVINMKNELEKVREQVQNIE